VCLSETPSWLNTSANNLLLRSLGAFLFIMVPSRLIIMVSLVLSARAIQLDKKLDIESSVFRRRRRSADAAKIRYGILHYVSECDQCGGSWCQEDEINYFVPTQANERMVVGSSLADFGCSNLKPNPLIWRNSLDGGIYVEEPLTIHHVDSCTACHGFGGAPETWCGDVSMYALNEPNIEDNYIVGDTLTQWGCSNVPMDPTPVRNSASGAIYVIQPGRPGVLHHLDNCQGCGSIDLCATYAMDAPGVSSQYTIGMSFADWGCENLPDPYFVIRDSASGAIYILGSYENESPTPSPTLATASPTSEPACLSWCAPDTRSWSTKCAYNSCKTCTTCDVPDCTNWCYSDTRTWASKCGFQGQCNNCPACSE